MAWEVIGTATFRDWYYQLNAEQSEAVEARVDLLAAQGPILGRPVVDRVRASKYHNMKELRASKDGTLRILFIFDPSRNAVLLIGGDKTGQWHKWYIEAIPQAENEYEEYLSETGQ